MTSQGPTHSQGLPLFYILQAPRHSDAHVDVRSLVTIDSYGTPCVRTKRTTARCGETSHIRDRQVSCRNTTCRRHSVLSASLHHLRVISRILLDKTHKGHESRSCTTVHANPYTGPLKHFHVGSWMSWVVLVVLIVAIVCFDVVCGHYVVTFLTHISRDLMA